MRHCSQCSCRTLTVKGEKVVEYYHRGVVCHLMGFDLALPLDVEMIHRLCLGSKFLPPEPEPQKTRLPDSDRYCRPPLRRFGLAPSPRSVAPTNPGTQPIVPPTPLFPTHPPDSLRTGNRVPLPMNPWKAFSSPKTTPKIPSLTPLPSPFT
jgi:hypothetical protein